MSAKFSDYDLMALPVVDKEGRLVGIVTVDDVMDVMEQEATEDIEKLAGMLPSDKPYSRTGIVEIWKNRIPWLMFLMLSATFTSMILTSFEDMLAVQAGLVAFIPMLMGTGGNSGAQASTAVIRALSLGDIEPRDALSVMWRELRDRQHVHRLYRPLRQECGLHAADPGREDRRGPGGHGKPSHFHGDGCRVPAHLYLCCKADFAYLICYGTVCSF